MTADAVVVGAGPAGVAAALTLARTGRAVALVHGGEGAAHRVESLPGAARPLLRDLGLLAAADAHPPGLGALSVWGRPAPDRREALFDPHGAGWHLDRARFDADARAVAERAGVALVRGRARVRHADGGWRVDVSGRSIAAPFAVDASGRAGVVARAAGAVRTRLDRTVAVVELARDGGGADGWTRVEAVPEGWWVSVRAGPLRMTAFHTEAGLLDRGLLSPSGFAAARAGAPWLDAALGETAPQGPPHGLDAGSAAPDRVAGPGWLAVGDAALAVDPLSSQGHLNALYSGLRGGQAAAAALDGDPAALDAYARRLATVRATYLAHRDAFYGAEARWPEAPFWADRARFCVAAP